MSVVIEQGLTAAEADARLQIHGPNEIAKPRSRSLWNIMVGALREPMFLLLVGATGFYFVLGDWREGLFLAVGAALTIGLVVYQEARSEGALRALRSLAQPQANIIRDGFQQKVDARSLVPGDIVLVTEGERLPADARLLRGDPLAIDESMLTGESAPVTRRPLAGEDAASESLLFAGTIIVRGSGVGEVTETGARTALGKIGASLASGRQEPTPLQKTTHRLIAYLAAAALSFCVIVFLAYGFLRNDWLQGGLTSLTVAVSLLPEEFPMVLAMFLALGSWRLARHNVLVRRSAVIEALGGATLLCVDKTGTLTQNQMKLARVWTKGRATEVDDEISGAAVGPLLQIAALASASQSLDPMDRAVLERASHKAFRTTPDRSWPLKPERLAVIQIWREEEGEIAAAKGAPETIFRMCRLKGDDLRAARAAVEDMAADGLRILAVARAKEAERFPDDPDTADFDFDGLIAFIDPLRENVPAALAEAKSAGIGVAMITGDHPATALAIARQAGIDVRGGALTGEEIDRLDARELASRLVGVRVFARIKPDQKLRLVEAFRARGEVVVMTGDGVNDGPALQAADIGIAMGRRGTDVAREAADIVLLDDSFASIVGGVRLGRRIFANLRKALTYVTAIHVPMAGLALAPLLLGWPALFFPMHVVLLELVIDPVCALVFESEPSEARSMQKRPRDREEPLFGPRHVVFALFEGAILLIAACLAYGWALTVTTEAQARGATFASLVLAYLLMAMANASGGQARLFDRRHAVFWLISAVATGILGVAFAVPAIASILRIAFPPLDVLWITIAATGVAAGWLGVVKRFQSRSRSSNPRPQPGDPNLNST